MLVPVHVPSTPTRPSRRWQAQVTTHNVLRREHALQLVREFVLHLPVRPSNPAPPLLRSEGRARCPMSCLHLRMPRSCAARAHWQAPGLQRSPEPSSYRPSAVPPGGCMDSAVAESGVRAPGREWRWFPEPRRTAHWCVVIHFDVLPRACQHSAGRWPCTWRSLCCCHALPLGSLE